MGKILTIYTLRSNKGNEMLEEEAEDRQRKMSLGLWSWRKEWEVGAFVGSKAEVEGVPF